MKNEIQFDTNWFEYDISSINPNLETDQEYKKRHLLFIER